MSRTSEGKEAALRAWQATPVYLTPEGLAKLQGKLEHLKRILPNLIDEVARTGAFGDRSENVEYVDAKGKLRRTQNQIYRIEDQLKKIKIIASGPDISGKAQIGSTVYLKQQGGEEKVFRIVGPDETNPASGFISYLSPLGAALIGHSEGEEISLAVADSIKKYVILKIK